jgi:hypothetical protein
MGAWCLLGYVCLYAYNEQRGGSLVFYYHNVFAGWNFRGFGGRDTVAFWALRDDLLEQIRRDGPESVISYFDRHAQRRLSENNIPGVREPNDFFGVP